jgi:putative chitinase
MNPPEIWLDDAAGVKKGALNIYYNPLLTALTEFDISTAKRAAMFIAQVLHESGGFRYMEEIASGAAYEFRQDLGNLEEGDGKRYKGRGPIQITGRANYLACSKALLGDMSLLSNPKRLCEPELGCRAAGWFWTTRNLNAFADAGDLKGCTKKINGGFNGLADRDARYQRCLEYIK